MDKSGANLGSVTINNIAHAASADYASESNSSHETDITDISRGSYSSASFSGGTIVFNNTDIANYSGHVLLYLARDNFNLSYSLGLFKMPPSLNWSLNNNSTAYTATIKAQDTLLQLEFFKQKYSGSGAVTQYSTKLTIYIYKLNYSSGMWSTTPLTSDIYTLYYKQVY